MYTDILETKVTMDGFKETSTSEFKMMKKKVLLMESLLSDREQKLCCPFCGEAVLKCHNMDGLEEIDAADPSGQAEGWSSWLWKKICKW
ncbi:hypothetical protein PVAP13_9NG853400 [Panicum virgatum]|uniref:Uncharacterized protein n=1 Tax=Panicum virgatum TaxID=38727 RepID=A0A8T0N5J4_PANVG|nr:hypothetical protein PVAP13_9NG853400 [Panicum virgatum]KAG2542346.1 hypothetical protein PVAP13_9NG853400 [Panicum virgatum]KAG2542348.1 hypothetical protein PVAP13_9NG853400 [Panicum virgatum]